MRTNLILITALSSVALVGCATPKPSTELASARALYQQASGGEAARQNPDELRDAQLALAEAEQAYLDDPGSQRERDLAYIADRKIRLAMVHAGTERVVAQHDRMDEGYTGALEDRVESAQDEAGSAQTDLASVQAELRMQGDTLDTRTEELQQEREARVDAERTAADALGRLEDFAGVQREMDRIVITLSGAVLFRANQTALLPMAQQRLGQVVEALRSQPDGTRILVVGHADDRGSEASSMQLSQARANSVRGFLVTHGVSATHVEAVGRGEHEPVGNNRTTEGRAENRRVEIILRRPPSDEQVQLTDTR